MAPDPIEATYRAAARRAVQRLCARYNTSADAACVSLAGRKNVYILSRGTIEKLLEPTKAGRPTLYPNGYRTAFIARRYVWTMSLTNELGGLSYTCTAVNDDGAVELRPRVAARKFAL